MKRILQSPFVLLAATLVAFAGREDNPVFAPDSDTELTKSFTRNMQFDLDDLSLMVDGQDIGAMFGSIELSATNEMTATVTDRYASVADGRPERLFRTFDALSMDSSFSAASDMGGDDTSVPGESDLEGSTVLFSWNDEEGEYDVSFEDEAGDEELLEGLEEDMDLRVLLPDGEVSEGDEWEVDVADLISIVMPGGDLSIMPEDAEDAGDFGEQFTDGISDSLSELFDGTCTCTYKGSRDEDGVQVAEIAVTIQISSSADLTDILVDMMEEASAEFGGEMPDIEFDSADLTLDFDGEGALLWNLGAGFVHSFDVSGSGGLAIDISVSADVTGEGEMSSVDLSAEFSGTVEESVSTD